MRKAILILIVLGSAACLCFLIWNSQHRLRLRTHFQSAQGLRTGAAVQVDGVALGTVTTVDIGGQVGKAAIQVTMVLHSPYKLSIPSDSIASLQTDGVLGPTFVAIDTRGATGPNIGQDGNVKSQESDVTNEGVAHALEVLGNAMVKEAHKIREEGQSRVPESDRQH